MILSTCSGTMARPMLKQPRLPRKSRLERGRDVTLIIGFPLAGYVVLGADGEEGGMIEKSAIRKISTVRHPTCVCVIGGAGHSDFIDLAVQHTREALQSPDDEPMSLERLREILEGIVTAIYDERIDYLPGIQQQDAEFSLLCALWTKESAEAQLVKVGRRYCLIRSNPDVAGVGSYLARYL